VQKSYYAYDASLATVEAMLAALKSRRRSKSSGKHVWTPAWPHSRICYWRDKDRVRAEYDFEFARRSVTIQTIGARRSRGHRAFHALKVARWSALALAGGTHPTP